MEKTTKILRKKIIFLQCINSLGIRQPFWVGYLYLPEKTVSASMTVCRHPAPFWRHSAMLGLSCESAVYPVIIRMENRKLGLIISPSHLHHRLIPQQTGNLAVTQHLNIGKKMWLKGFIQMLFICQLLCQWLEDACLNWF